MDAVIFVDGFEHVMEGGGSSAGSGVDKVHVVLTRIMDILYQYHGCVMLFCHIENPQNVLLQRDFASKLLTFIRFSLPSHDLRTALWKSLLPTTVPLAADIKFETLGRRFEINAGSIRAAIVNAASEAAMRKDNAVVSMSDLLQAGEQEISKLKSGNFDMISKLFN